jgi:hypothetical protein
MQHVGLGRPCAHGDPIRPRSAHDAEALAVLAAHAATCTDARPLLAGYLRLHPGGPFAVDARIRLAACPPAER